MRLRVPVFKCSVSLWYSTNSTREFGTSSAFVCATAKFVCASHHRNEVKRKKEKGRCLILFGQKSERSEKRKTQREGEKGGKKTNVKKKRKKAKRVGQTPASPSLEKGRLSPFQFYFFIVNNYTCVCLLCCLRERERGRVRSEQHSSLKIHAHAYRSNKGSIDLETRATPHTDIS